MTTTDLKPADAFGRRRCGPIADISTVKGRSLEMEITEANYVQWYFLVLGDKEERASCYLSFCFQIKTETIDRKTEKHSEG